MQFVDEELNLDETLHYEILQYLSMRLAGTLIVLPHLAVDVGACWGHPHMPTAAIQGGSSRDLESLA